MGASWGEKASAAFIGACLGVSAGFFASYFVDHGDVGSALFGMLIAMPGGAIIGALLGWFAMRHIGSIAEQIAGFVLKHVK